MHDSGEYGYPVKPYCPGKNSLQEMSEALDREQRREEQRRKTGGIAPVEDWEQRQADLEAIYKGQSILERERAYYRPDDFFMEE
jgi:hypothetical protein